MKPEMVEKKIGCLPASECGVGRAEPPNPGVEYTSFAYIIHKLIISPAANRNLSSQEAVSRVSKKTSNFDKILGLSVQKTPINGQKPVRRGRMARDCSLLLS